MPRFFVETVSGDTAVITGADAHHIARVLRMRIGEPLVLCDGKGMDYHSEIQAVDDREVVLRVTSRTATVSEPSVQVTLYQGLPKSEKMDWIVQKAVELGVARIVPVAMLRSVVKLSAADGEKKRVRWQKIAAEAAGQSGRGCIPVVEAPLSLKQVAAQLQQPTVVFYEGGGEPLSRHINRTTPSVSVVIGPEGGFDSAEIEALTANGAVVATLGKRILRCETAPIAALSVIMQLTGNME